MTSYRLAIHNLHSMQLGQTACFGDKHRPAAHLIGSTYAPSVLTHDLGEIRIAEVGLYRTALVLRSYLSDFMFQVD